MAGSPLGIVILDLDLEVVVSGGSQAGELPSLPELRALGTYVRDTGELVSDGSVTCYPIRRGDQLIGVGCVVEVANRIRDQFLSVLSHELRVPLTTLLLWERLLHEQHEPQQRDKALAAIRQSAETLSRLINELVDGSRALSGKLRIDRRTISVDRTLAEAIERMLPRYAAKHVQLVREVTELGSCSGDATRLRQAFESVLANALDLCPDDGIVRLRAHRDGEEIELAVQHAGAPLSAAQRSLMFEPFTQLAVGLPRSDGDLGLGLSTARAVVELHDGTIEAHAAPDGEGSVITIRIPASPGPADGESKRLVETALAGLEIMLVDDDPDVLTAMRMLLDVMGAHVQCEHSATSAIAALETRVPDVLLCDVWMPEEDGNSLIRRVRRLPGPASKVRAIALSGATKNVDGSASLEAGFDRHLPKPVDIDRLVATIRELTQRS